MRRSISVSRRLIRVLRFNNGDQRGRRADGRSRSRDAWAMERSHGIACWARCHRSPIVRWPRVTLPFVHAQTGVSQRSGGAGPRAFYRPPAIDPCRPASAHAPARPPARNLSARRPRRSGRSLARHERVTLAELMPPNARCRPLRDDGDPPPFKGSNLYFAAASFAEAARRLDGRNCQDSCLSSPRVWP